MVQYTVHALTKLSEDHWTHFERSAECNYMPRQVKTPFRVRFCENFPLAVRWINLVPTPWWWVQRWWLTSPLRALHDAAFTGDDETQQRYGFHLLCLLWLHGECDTALNMWNEMENRYIFHLLRRNYGREFILDKFEMNVFFHMPMIQLELEV